jgi:hypothetical protein
MPLRVNRLREERVLDDLDSEDEDEEDKELFEGFVVIDMNDAKKIDDYMKKLNNPEKLQEESKRKAEGKSMLLFSKKQGSKEMEPESLEDFEILKVIDKGSFGKVFLVKFKKND